MKQVFKLAPLAAAIASLSIMGAVQANEHEEEGAHLSKHVSVTKDVEYSGNVEVDGRVQVNSLGMAVIDQSQKIEDNEVGNDRTDNNAVLIGNSLRNGKGNIGVNMAGGDHNAQSNSAALAATDASFVFGSADAEVFTHQHASGNLAINHGTINNAGFGANALENARGNIGVNVAAGNYNIQGNSFAGSVASGSMGEATVSVAQHSSGNDTLNLPEETYEVIRTRFAVGGTLEGTYQGEGSGDYSGTNGPADYTGSNGAARFTGTNTGATLRGSTGTSTYTGTSDQNGAVYPEVWTGGRHGDPGVSLWGHLDFDENQDDGTFSFTESGNISGASVNGRLTGTSQRGVVQGSSESGTVGASDASGTTSFTEVGTQSLSGTLTGYSDTLISRYVRHANNAVMGDDALNNARGNIGVNITAGTGNLQNNSLAMTKVDAMGMSAPVTEQQ